MRIFPLAAAALLLPIWALATTAEIIKPSDFQPLTSLPWKAPHATLESILDAIYHEPDSTIRYAVLGQYLWTIPADQLGKAFDLCIAREGTDTPDALIYQFLQLWAARDPQACWKRTEALFHVVGYDYSWMGYSSWADRITVQDVHAIQSSPFWIKASTLLGFPEGVDNSTLSKKDRVRFLREFADQWFTDFGTWPGGLAPGDPPPSGYIIDNLSDPAVIKAFSLPMDHFELSSAYVSSPGSWGQVEVEERRWLQAEPASARDIIAKMGAVAKAHFKGAEGDPSMPTLMVWAKVDKAGMIRWADTQDPAKANLAKDYLVTEVREFLLSRVDDSTRAGWLAAAKTSDPDGDSTQDYLEEWAKWDPVGALAEAVAIDKTDTIQQCAESAVYGPFDTCNSHLYGMAIVRKFDPTAIPIERRRYAVGQWDIMMEEWADIDVCDAARYGVNFLTRMDPSHREQFIEYCSGVDMDTKASDMARRTFNALRVWAVVRPNDMKAWIATLNDPKLQKAITWLLNHPWGGAARPNP